MLQNISINVLFDCHPYNLIELHEFTFHMKLIFLVLSEVNYNQISEIINDIPDNYEAQIVPIFNGGNIDFFEKYVFTSQEDLNTIKITKREVFIHQTLNSNDFGKIFILPDGSVHTNVNFEPLGSINNSPYSIVFKEITEGNSWLRIRNQKPCTNCIYQWLCPSPNNYELAFGKPNLCHINL
jgi:pseudo-rSAM protein